MKIINLGLPRIPIRGMFGSDSPYEQIMDFDFSSLTPLERIALADTLYDSAMQEIDAMTPQLTAEQLAQLDRRIVDVETGRVDLVPWAKVHAALNQRR